MDVFIRGGGFNNKGDEAMLLTVQRELAKRLPDANFIVSYPTDHVNSAYAFGLMARSHTAGRLNKLLRFLPAAATKPHVRRAAMSNLLSALEISDLDHVRAVFDISGFGYSDSWGPYCADRGMAWAQFCRRHGRQYVCLPQAWGPFSHPRVRRSVGELVRNSSLVYARDPASLGHLTTHFPDIRDKLRLAPDIAFLFRGAHPAAGAALLNRIGVCPGQGPIIGITPNQRVYERLPGRGAANQYIALLVRIARHCVERLKAKVVLLPHEIMYANRPKMDDRFLCGLVKARLSDVPDCVAINEVLFSDMTKSLIGHLDLVIGSRFHSLVFALASKVPVVALGWSHKYKELLKEFALDSFAMSHERFDEAEAIELIERAWRERAQSRVAIGDRLPTVQQDVASVFDRVQELVAAN